MDRRYSRHDLGVADIYSAVLARWCVFNTEYLGLRYNQSVRVVTALITSLFAVFAMGVAMWALALVLETYLGWPIWMSILVSGAVVGLYSITGGLAAVAFTDALQVSTGSSMV